MTFFTQKVFHEIDRLTEKYLGLLTDICMIESKSEDKAGVDQVGAYLAQFAGSLDYVVKKQEFEKAGNVYSFTLNPYGRKKMICLSGHMDTVHAKNSFGYPPVRVDGDYLYGPGVQDCKGGIAVAMLAMEALKNCGYTERPVRLILQSDEEVSSVLSQRKSIDFMLQEAAGSAAFLNEEGYTSGHITVGRKGIVKKKIVIKGKAMHAGACTQGVSAVREAAYKIIELEKDNDGGSITFNCGMVQGGKAINIVPDQCEVLVEYRFKTLLQQKAAEEKFQRIVNTSYVPGTEAVAEELSSRVPMERTPGNEALADAVNEIAENYGFEKMEKTESAGGADAAYTSQAGIPTVDSIGMEGSGCHTLGERVLIASLPRMAKLAAAIVIHLEDDLGQTISEETEGDGI